MSEAPIQKMTRREAELLYDYGRHAPSCVYHFPKNETCVCGFLDLIDQSKSVLDTAAPEQADADGVTELTEPEWLAKLKEGLESAPSPLSLYETGKDLAACVTRLRSDLATAEAERDAYGKGQERWDEMWRESEDDNTRLRADLATVTAERNEAFNVGTALETDLKAERAAHAESRMALSKVSAEIYLELDAEREGADGLADAANWVLHVESGVGKSGGAPDEDEYVGALDTLKDSVAAHDARRADGGEA